MAHNLIPICREGLSNGSMSPSANPALSCALADPASWAGHAYWQEFLVPRTSAAEASRPFSIASAGPPFGGKGGEIKLWREQGRDVEGIDGTLSDAARSQGPGGLHFGNVFADRIRHTRISGLATLSQIGGKKDPCFLLVSRRTH